MRKDTGKTAARERPSAMSVFMGTEPRVELHGTRQLLIEGSTGVIYYSDNVMRIGLGSRTLIVTGCELRISVMFGSTLTVTGSVKSVEFA